MTITTPEALLRLIQDRRTVPMTAISAEQEISEEHIDQLLEALNWAPNHGREQPWRVAVITGESRLRLARLLAEAAANVKGTAATPEAISEQEKRQLSAPLWMLVCAVTPENSRFPDSEHDQATAAGIQNMLLMAHALGLGAKWISAAAPLHVSVREGLGLPAAARTLGLFYFGVLTGDNPTGKRDPLAERVLRLS